MRSACAVFETLLTRSVVLHLLLYICMDIGGVVDGATQAACAAHGIDVDAYLQRHDSYHALQALDAAMRVQCDASAISFVPHHVITGPTGTNVMDIVCVLVR